MAVRVGFLAALRARVRGGVPERGDEKPVLMARDRMTKAKKDLSWSDEMKHTLPKDALP